MLISRKEHEGQNAPPLTPKAIFYKLDTVPHIR